MASPGSEQRGEEICLEETKLFFFKLLTHTDNKGIRKQGWSKA